jgi:hypothetical protein
MDGEKEAQQEMTYQDNMTLDEIKAYDMDMTRHAIKGATRYRFQDIRRAIAFVGECVRVTLDYLGLKNAEQMLKQANGKMLSRWQKENKIKIERRNKYQGKDIWRCGIYIYKADVLVAFIGEPLKEVPHPLLLGARQQDYGYLVVTNAKLSPNSRFFMVPLVTATKEVFQPPPAAPVSEKKIEGADADGGDPAGETE